MIFIKFNIFAVNHNTNFNGQTKRRTIACIERNVEKAHFKVLFTMDRLTNLFKPIAEFEISNNFFNYLQGILKCIMFFILNCSMQLPVYNRLFGENPKVNIMRYMKIKFGISRNMKIWGTRKIHSTAFACNKGSSFTNLINFNCWRFYNNKKLYKLLRSSEKDESNNIYSLLTDFKFLILVWTRFNSNWYNKFINNISKKRQKSSILQIFKDTANLLKKNNFFFSFIKTKSDYKTNYFLNKENIIQQAIYFVLEIIFEPKFFNNCNYQRVYKSYDTTLKFVKNTFYNVNYFVEGQLKHLCLNLKILTNYLKSYIKDQAFINLILDYLEFENEQNFKYTNIFKKSSSQRSNLSAMLVNIYLHQFDIWLNNLNLLLVNQKNFKFFNYQFGKLIQIKKYKKENIYIPIFFFKMLSCFYYVRINNKILLGIKDLKYKIDKLLNNILNYWHGKFIFKKFKLTHNVKNSILWLNHLIEFIKFKNINLKQKFKKNNLRKFRVIINAPISHILIKLCIQNIIKTKILYIRNSKFIQLPLFAIVKYFKFLEKKILHFYQLANNYYLLNKKIHYILKTACAFSIMSKMNLKTLKKTFKKYGKNLIIRNNEGKILIYYPSKK